MSDWQGVISRWKAEFGSLGLKTYAPAPPDALQQAKNLINLSDDLTVLYRCSNGLICDWLVVLPILDTANIKRTWDSIQRANDPQKTGFLNGDAALLERFLVFARLDAGRCAVMERATGSLWFEEDEELHLTTLSLPDFIETCLREVRDL